MPPAARFANTVRHAHRLRDDLRDGGAPAQYPAMRIACPACNAAYEVPDRLIGPGRRLRCARCGHDWDVQQSTPGVSAADDPGPPLIMRPQARLEAPPGPGSEPPPEPPPHSVLRRAPQVLDQDAMPRPGGDAAAPMHFLDGLWAAWAASILVVLAFLAALLVFRAEIAAAWPPAARLYTALGMEVGH
jgi:predicted Zn finger-like uncharacterized protein